ncbi:hypothetical protein O3Q51_05120 [Cryomorphaceae bacterium 1068]|nr:hypothetical protein [Cryomorphaceae bacterium 1068]
MDKKVEKPSPEAKALSLFLMAYKAKDPFYKEQLKRINRQWDLTKKEKISKNDYQEEVEKMLESYGGYDQVVEKTVRFYIDTTGKWNLTGDDKYCLDAKEIADRIKKK